MEPQRYKRNEVLVLGAKPGTIRTLLARGWRQESSAAVHVERLLSNSELSLAVVDQLQLEFPEARFALNYVYRHAGIFPGGQDDRDGPCPQEKCYGPTLINWQGSLAACAAGLKIGIIDTAIDKSHPALAWRKLEMIHFPTDKGSIKAPDAHGTAIVSLLTGDPHSATPGLIPSADYIIADGFYSNNSGDNEIDTVHLLWALATLHERGAQIINMSFSGPRDNAVHALVREMSLSGVVFVAAAGNGGPVAAPVYPAAYPEVIAVTAVDQDKKVYTEANYGMYIDMAAPGVRIWAALPNNTQGVVSGTSFAVPFVTAVAAAIYNNIPKNTGGKDKIPPFNPKAEILARLSFEKLGLNPTGERDLVFGMGLVRAPTSCAPDVEGSPVSTRQRPQAGRQAARREVSLGIKQ
jgi:subtilisin family serine protease